MNALTKLSVSSILILFLSSCGGSNFDDMVKFREYDECQERFEEQVARMADAIFAGELAEAEKWREWSSETEAECEEILNR